MQYTLIVDDDQREEDPSAPWTAMLVDSDGSRFGEAGYADTIDGAVRNLFLTFRGSLV